MPLAALITYPQAIMLGLLQGVSELFPISSLGHSVILPQLLGWDIHQNDPYFVTFLVATHLATALVLLGFFWRDWVRIVKGLGRSLRDREIGETRRDAKLGWLLVVGTIPAGILGLALEHKLRSVFASATSASFFLMLNGLLLYGAEQLRRRAPQVGRGRRRADREAGRPGATRSSSARRRRSRSSPASRAPARRWAAASSSGCPTRTRPGSPSCSRRRSSARRRSSSCRSSSAAQGDGVRGQALVASLCSALTAYLAVRFLMRFFETRTLMPFAIYCFVAGVVLPDLLRGMSVKSVSSRRPGSTTR